MIAVTLFLVTTEMGTYSIKELEQLSGIKAHTIRIWEKRYQIIAPQRTATNIRLYTDDDLKRIINVSLLNNHGVKISKIAGMSDPEIRSKILELNDSKHEANLYVDQLVVAMVEMDEEGFDGIISELVRKFGLETCITAAVYPFLEKIGVLWQTGSITPAHEHFISNLIRQRLIFSIASLPITSTRSIKAILFLPEGELHELGLLFFHYIARSKGIKTFYLGQSVPHRDLKMIYQIHRPHILITSLVSSPPPKQLEGYLNLLSTDFPDATILVSGMMMRNTSFLTPKNVKPFYKATELPALIDALN